MFITAAKFRLLPLPVDNVDDQKVETKSGYSINNPIGLSAGFDTNGSAIDGLFDLGFGFIEIGSGTSE